VITSTGFGAVDWGDGHGLETDKVFALNCHVDMLSEHMRRKPIRPAAETARQPSRRPSYEHRPPAAANPSPARRGTAKTAAVLADPAATRAQREHAAEMEQAAHILYLQRPGADAELQAEAEMEAGT